MRRRPRRPAHAPALHLRRRPSLRRGREPRGESAVVRRRPPLGHARGLPLGVAQDHRRVRGCVGRSALRDPP
eukprot:9875392-Alexandrium_andersonii.AAC.1